MEQGLIDLRNKAKEYGKKHGMVAQFPTSCENVVALIDRIEHLHVIEAAAIHAEATLRKASKETVENGWIPTAPQYFAWLADALASALAQPERGDSE
jgi:hypothetical protein